MKLNIKWQEICETTPLSSVLINLLPYLCICPRKQFFPVLSPVLLQCFSTLEKFPNLKGKWQMTQSNTPQSFLKQWNTHCGVWPPSLHPICLPTNLLYMKRNKGTLFWLCISGQFLTSWYFGVWFSHQGFFSEKTQWTHKKRERNILLNARPFDNICSIMFLKSMKLLLEAPCTPCLQKPKAHSLVSPFEC